MAPTHSSRARNDDRFDGNYIVTDAISVTPDLIRAGRALVRLSARELAERSGVSLPTIQRIEAADDVGGTRVDTLRKLISALAKAGVDMIRLPDGGLAIRLRPKSGFVSEPESMYLRDRKSENEGKGADCGE
jgi:transcriptional regulator with XRE-family HTH domain